MKLGETKKGMKGCITQVGQAGSSVELIERFLEMGLLEGAYFEALHEAPWSGDPIVVRVRGSLLALRRQEANQIEVVVHE